MDRGANGCILGKDVRVVHLYGRYIDLSGIDDHTVQNLQLATAAAYILTDHGPIIGLFHQGAIMSRGKTILSPGQLEHFGCDVHDKSRLSTGTDPYFVTPNGFRIPMAVKSGLPYVQLRPPTDDELDDSAIPHVDLTSPHVWDPSCLDSVPAADWFDQQNNDLYDDGESPLDPLGKLRDFDDDFNDCSDRNHLSIYRRGIIKAMAHLIDDELSVPSLVQRESNGYDSDSSDESLSDSPRSCHIQTRSQLRQRQRQRQPPPPAPTATPLPSDAGEKLHKETPTAGIPTAAKPPSLRSPSGKAKPVVETVLQDDNTDQPKSNNRAKHHTGLEHPTNSRKLKTPDVSELRRFFPGVTDETIKRTFNATTQYGTKGATKGRTLRGQIVSPNPILNIPRRHEDVATDTIYGSTPAINDGSTAAQLFIGRTSHYRTLRPGGKSDASYIKNLMDEIRKLGAMNRMRSDNAQAQCNERVKDVYRTFCIDDWQSEPYRGNQNFAELGWKDTKRKIQMVLDTRNVPSDCWLLSGQFICALQNHIALEVLGWRTPFEWLFGFTPDISALIQFEFYEPVYYQKYGGSFPKDSAEAIGRFVGVAEDVGHGMTYKILTGSGKIITRAVARTARKGAEFSNWKADELAPKLAPKPKPISGRKSPVSEADPRVGATMETNVLKKESGLDETEGNEEFFAAIRKDISSSLQDKDVLNGGSLPTIDITNLLNRSFITNPNEEGEQSRAKVVSAEPTGETDADGSEAVYRFRCKHGEDYFDEYQYPSMQ
ncbi:Retrotransposon protein [Seminavis robusta]|uniref:Retrotransposon protein n=1 Tax=Seminavis robusta TaxID=568900 RepID=A0A9N8ERM6_9STRA|nr:Retrotransposon protein [Seminavis robusta]|eukprot:Sro1687_g291190.1 Retrotransposon protein (770) ;mRNA; r:4739-7235